MKRTRFLKWLLIPSVSAMVLFGSSPVLAGPVELTPVVVEGKMAPYFRVKKYNRIWYPASVVGHYRQINFAYDYATNTLYANGEKTLIQSLVVDDVVYVNMTPTVTADGMRPGMDMLAAQEAEMLEMEKASSHMQGYTQTRMMAHNVSGGVHPWAQSPVGNEAPIIDLDPTAESEASPFMQPGARPPDMPTAPLPDRLPRPGEETAGLDGPVETVRIPPTNPLPSMPLTVTTQGGPVQSNATQPVETAARPDANGLQPIPRAVPVAPDRTPFDSSGKLRATSGQNSVFKVAVTSGDWQVTQSDRMLKVKLNQTNLSRVAQSNLGSFSVRCENGTRVEASRTRSYLPDGTLAPGSAREGELVFRLTGNQEPKSLELEGALSLSVPLQRLQ